MAWDYGAETGRSDKKNMTEAIEKIAAQYDDKWVEVIEVVVGN